ncbi:MAG: SufBD protein, partial [Tissierellaceae bacterium]
NTFDEILGLLNTKSSYVRTRGFVLCCAQARWDEGGKLQKALPTMLALLHDDKPIVVRQCLAALHEVVLYRSELREAIKAELGAIDFSRHKESMSPLIKKDVEELLNLID